MGPLPLSGLSTCTGLSRTNSLMVLESSLRSPKMRVFVGQTSTQAGCRPLTARVVPDYPLLREAQFYYEVEMGNIEKAKQFSEYIDNSQYMRIVHDVDWTSGYKP